MRRCRRAIGNEENRRCMKAYLPCAGVGGPQCVQFCCGAEPRRGGRRRPAGGLPRTDGRHLPVRRPADARQVPVSSCVPASWACRMTMCTCVHGCLIRSNFNHPNVLPRAVSVMVVLRHCTWPPAEQASTLQALACQSLPSAAEISLAFLHFVLDRDFVWYCCRASRGAARPWTGLSVYVFRRGVVGSAGAGRPRGDRRHGGP